jgi:hypothetical protein
MPRQFRLRRFCLFGRVHFAQIVQEQIAHRGELRWRSLRPKRRPRVRRATRPPFVLWNVRSCVRASAVTNEAVADCRRREVTVTLPFRRTPAPIAREG